MLPPNNHLSWRRLSFSTILICLIGLLSYIIAPIRAGTISAQTSTNNHLSYKLIDKAGHSVLPISVIRVGNDLYFLSPECLWWCAGAKTVASQEDLLILRRLEPPVQGELSIPWQEFTDFVYLPERQSLIILDKSGDLFAFVLNDQSTKHWRVFRANSSKLGPPDPDYVSFCAMNNEILLLDPERNQIWLSATGSAGNCTLKGLLSGVLAWKLKRGDTNVTDAIAINCIDRQIYVLRKNGAVSKYGIVSGAQHQNHTRHHRNYNYQPANIFCCAQGQMYFKRPSHIRPSRICPDASGNLYLVERENNRVLKISSQQQTCKAFIFPIESDLRGLIISGDGFWIISGDHLLYKGKETPGTDAQISPHTIDKRLTGLILPIEGQVLPGHPGVYPGARRLYRFGVHNGLDLFNQLGARIRIVTGTPARAACAGQVIRVDSAYKDMNYASYSKVIRECWQAHQTSEKNADLLRGCQVWIDSGNGLITKYAHLYRANNKIHVGDRVRQGDIIGYVGVSGTGENLPGRVPYPHLHFEIWLDGKYLGWGLNAAETMSLVEDIFAPNKR